LKKRLVSYLALVTLLCSCGGGSGVSKQAGADPEVKVLATVNDVSITERDVQQVQKKAAHAGGMVHPGSVDSIVRTLVRDELIYQKAVELGLDRNPEYQRKLRDFEAQLRAFQRQEMGTLFRGDLRSKSAVTETDAQAFFERNMKKVQTKYHVMQIFYRGNLAQITRDHQDLNSGMPFETVVARGLPNLPKNMAPWDLGYLSWSQIPAPWRDTLDRLEAGQTSDVINGPGERFWVIKLVDKTVDPAITFATEKAKIVEVLQAQKAEEIYAKTLDELQGKAKIVFSN
jgi:parvulin-like peptidyl-prolyl isomerase